MNQKTKNILIGVVVVVLIAVLVVWMLLNPAKQIEDTNGPDDQTLATITDADIVASSISSTGTSISTGVNFTVGGVHVSSGVKFHSDQFSGVEEIFTVDYLLPSDFELNLSSFTVDGGNFKMVVVHDDEIIATIEPGEDVKYSIENITGTVSLRIAGESASFCFYMDESEYNSFN